MFPGFEPSLKDGRSGLHSYSLRPEIGRTNYLKAFDLVMGSVSPWPDEPNNQLRMSSRSAEEAFHNLENFTGRYVPSTTAPSNGATSHSHPT